MPRGTDYECDCCGAKVPRDRIAMVIAYGIETAACCACRGVEPDDADLIEMLGDDDAA
jgi:hypothetical protein